jgi:NAD(P)-dependent dehydrogenase (short-subunit alcohol dehydrogenase family)
MADRLEGKVAIVTGSSSGNGRAIALAFAREGAAVVCSDVQKSAQEGGYEEDIEVDTDDAIRKEGGRAEYQEADASKASDMQAVVDKAVSSFGKLDLMVNNAGVFTGLNSILDETEEQYDFSMAVNAKGVWLGSKFAIAQMMKQELPEEGSRGKIINIASIGGVVGLMNEPAYCASKGAAVNLTRQLAIDFAPEKINVNAICPGFLSTAMVRQFLEDPELNQTLHDLSPWPHLGTAEDVAKMAVYLASDDAEMVTGSIHLIDGGYTAG